MQNLFSTQERHYFSTKINTTYLHEAATSLPLDFPSLV